MDAALVAALISWVGCHSMLWWTSRARSGKPLEGGWLIALLAGAGAWLVQLAAVPWASGDVFLYLAHASTWTDFRDNPYLVAPAANPANPFWQLAPWRYLPAQYGPLAVLISVGLLKPHAGLWGSLIVSRLFGMATLAGAFLCARWIARDLRLPIERETWWLLATSPLLITEVGVAAHNDSWVALPLMIAILASLRGWWGLAFASVAASAAIKYSTVILLPLFALGLWRSPPRGVLRWLELAVGVLVIALGAFFVSRWFGGVSPLANGFAAAAVLRAKSIVWLLGCAAEGLGLSAGPIAALSRAVVVVLAIMVALRIHRPVVAPNAVFATYLLFVVFAVAWFQPWYLVPLFPVCLLATSRRARDVAILFAATSLLGIYAVFFAIRSWSTSAQIVMTLITFVPVLVAMRRHAGAILGASRPRGR